jgi:hypothetical protein
MESKDISELIEKRVILNLELEDINKEISRLEAKQREENINRVAALMNELDITASDFPKISKMIKTPSKKDKITSAVFRDPQTDKMFANKGSYGKRIRKLLDAGFSFEDIVIDKSRVEELKEKFLASEKIKRSP